MNIKWLIGVMLVIALPVGASLINQSAKGQTLETKIENLDRREMGHVVDNERAIERTNVKLEKIDDNLQKLVNDFIEFRAEMKRRK